MESRKDHNIPSVWNLRHARFHKRLSNKFWRLKTGLIRPWGRVLMIITGHPVIMVVIPVVVVKKTAAHNPVKGSVLLNKNDLAASTMCG